MSLLEMPKNFKSSQKKEANILSQQVINNIPVK